MTKINNPVRGSFDLARVPTEQKFTRKPLNYSLTLNERFKKLVRKKTVEGSAKIKMHELMMKYVDSNLNIIHYFRKNQDIFFLKQLLFSQSQLATLNRIKKINISNSYLYLY